MFGGGSVANLAEKDVFFYDGRLLALALQWRRMGEEERNRGGRRGGEGERERNRNREGGDIEERERRENRGGREGGEREEKQEVTVSETLDFGFSLTGFQPHFPLSISPGIWSYRWNFLVTTNKIIFSRSQSEQRAGSPKTWFHCLILKASLAWCAVSPRPSLPPLATFPAAPPPTSATALGPSLVPSCSDGSGECLRVQAQRPWSHLQHPEV